MSHHSLKDKIRHRRQEKFYVLYNSSCASTAPRCISAILWSWDRETEEDGSAAKTDNDKTEKQKMIVSTKAKDLFSWYTPFFSLLYYMMMVNIKVYKNYTIMAKKISMDL